MKNVILLAYVLFSSISVSAQYHRTKVPTLEIYNGVDIEVNMNRLLNEIISFDFSECGLLSTIYSINAKDTIWIRKTKNPLKAKIDKDFKVNHRNAKIEDLEGKEFLVRAVDKEIIGEIKRDFYSVLTLENIMDAHDIYTWKVKTLSYHSEIDNSPIRVRSKRWSEEVNQYLRNGSKYYYYHSPERAKPNVENGHTEYVKIHYEKCDFFLGGKYLLGRYISKYKDNEGNDYIFDEYKLRDTELPITEEEYKKIVAERTLERKSAGKYYYTLSKVVKPYNKSIRYGKMEERKLDGLSSQYFYEDNTISILIMGGTKQFEFVLSNKTKNSIRLVWDEASFIDINNMVSKVIHKGVKYMDANNAQPATSIPGGTSISEIIAPSSHISYSDSWYQQPIISNKVYDPNIVGKIIKILLPIEINGVVNEYMLYFTIGWKYTYPEYQNSSNGEPVQKK